MIPLATGTSAKDRRVVFINRFFYPDRSATGQLLTDLTLALIADGHPVRVICSRQQYDQARFLLPARETWSGIEVHRVWTSNFGRGRLLGRSIDYLTFYIASALAIMWIVRKQDTLVVKTDPPLLAIPAMLVAWFKGADQVNWLQDVFPEVATALGANPAPPILDAALRFLRNASLRFAKVNVVLGGRMRERVIGMGAPSASVQIIENWAQEDPGGPILPSSSALRSRLSAEQQFVFAYSGNLGRAHDYATVIGAASILRLKTQFLFLMVGGGTGMRQLAAEVRRQSLPNFVFLPYQPREALADCLAAADAHWVSLRPALEGLIVPSKYYGILAAARPVVFIGDSDGELARAIGQCACGEVVEEGACEKLANLLIDWDLDRTHLEQMGRNGYAQYFAKYSSQNAFAKWRRILRLGNHAVGVSPRSLSNR